MESWADEHAAPCPGRADRADAADRRAEAVFDPATGLHVAACRAPVHDSVPGGRVMDAAGVAAMAADGAPLIDAMAAPEDAIAPEGTWTIIELHETIPGALGCPRSGAAILTLPSAPGCATLAPCPGPPIVLFCKTDCWMS